MKSSAILLPALLLLSLAGCASVSMVDSWKDRAAPQTPYRNFLVVGVTDNRQMRQVFEEILAAKLRSRGVAATPSYTVTGVEERQTRAALEQASRAAGADAVIATRVVDTKRETRMASGYVMSDRSKVGPVSFALFDSKPVEITTSTTTSLETDLFDAGTRQLVWSGTSNAVNPQGIIGVSEEFADVVVNAMNKEGLVP